MDILLEKDFIAELVKGIDSSLEVGWVAGRFQQLKGLQKTEEIDCFGHYLCRDRYAKEVDYSRPFRWDDYSKRQYVFGACAGAALYRREMLEDIKLGDEYFDEDFFAYFEDVDFDWRAQLAGWKCLYVPPAVAYHERGGSGLIR